MNKKQRNKKLVLQNKRNRMINRHYTTTIKNLSKLLISNRQEIQSIGEDTEKSILLNRRLILIKKFNSSVDKAVKKGVIHKNTAARKKSKLTRIIINIKNSNI
uniref:Ribosomal protein S20 n=1 Tax=Neotessella volvocina TaxID=52559 RepID=A0A3G2QZR6_9STRA|nr:ribosomal protein S20 [Neotessella volvocina]